METTNQNNQITDNQPNAEETQLNLNAAGNRENDQNETEDESETTDRTDDSENETITDEDENTDSRNI